ncbi:TetR/AcrR family transcriptional regulator [Nocardioides speluncae]|uniref:TetR/AcrR family transcriptional regulator n=1 Tax=Nocardioides speluncae TaxID=2670337 RepID=UPI000D69DE7E|nr:TetR/AcrR family transcriptional regulator [Nocardioides speluncae]
MSKGQETKTAILDEAAQVASKVGFNALTIGHLADVTSMSKSGLFAHFRSKEQLQLQTLEHARQQMVDVVIRPALRAPRGEPRVRELFDRWLDWATDTLSGGCIFVAASFEYDDQPGPMQDAIVGQKQEWRDLVVGVTRMAVTEGHFRADLDPEQFAFEFEAITVGYHLYVRLLHDEQAANRVRTAFESLLAAARPT